MSLIRSNQLSQPGSYTGSLQGTASWANNVVTASYAQTASYVNPLNQNVIITGSIYLPDNAHSIYFSGSQAASRLTWNDTDGTLDLGLKGGNVTLQIGQEEVVRVVNKTGINLTEAGYQAVRLDGAQGGRVKVALAKGDADGNSLDTLGLVTENIAINAEGYVTTTGLVRGINTTGNLQGETWVDGDSIYLSPTTAGGLTKFPPTAPSHSVRMGYVVQSNPSQGSIYVKVDNGYELDELHNVAINDATLAYGDLLMRGNSGVWTNTKQLSGSYGLTGSLSFRNGGVTGSVFGTASWASSVISSSYAGTASVLLGSIASASYASTSSWTLNVVSSSYALTASYVQNTISASNSLTASYLNTLNQDLTFNGNLTLNGTASISYLNVAFESASVIYSSGSNQFGDAANDVQSLYGSVIVPIGSLTVTGSSTISGSLNIIRPGGGTAFSLRNTDGNAIGGGNFPVYEPYNFADASHNFNIGHGSAGNYNWFAGTNATLNLNTQLMRLTRGGNLLIGTTTDLGYRLDVSGNTRINGTINMSGSLTDYNLIDYSGSAFNTRFRLRDWNWNAAAGVSLDSNNIFLNPAGEVRTAGTYLIVGSTYTSIGAGYPATTARLTVRGSGATSTTTSVRVENSNASASLVVLDNGFVGVNTGSAQFNLDVSGSGRFTNGLTVTGSLIAPTITGSLQGTSSWAVSSSLALTASYILQAVSSSFTATASYVTGSIYTSTNPALSASYALTASYALNGGGGGGTPGGSNTQIQYNNSSTFAGVPTLTYDGTILRATGSFTGSFTGNLTGTASFATTASIASTSSFLTPGTYTVTSSWAQSASQASTASLAPLYLPLAGGSLTGNLSATGRTFTIQDLVLTNGTTQGKISSDSGAPGKPIGMYPNVSVETTRFYGNGNVGFQNGGTYTDTGFRVQISASGAVSGAFQVIGSSSFTGSINVLGGITGSLLGTASWATNTISASYVTGSVHTSANPALSASYALTASYALNGGSGAAFPYTGNAVITGSLLVSGSGGLLVTSQSKLADALQVESLNWGSRTLYDASSNLSLEWVNRYMQDSSGATSIDWQNRILNDASGFYSIKWELRQLTDTSGGNTLIDYSYPHKVDINVPIQQKSPITAQEDISSNGPEYWNGQAIEVASVDSGVTLYDLCYLESNNIWYTATNTNATATRLLGIFIDSTSKLMLLEGDIRVNDINNGNGPYIETATSITPGAPTYLGDAGAMTQIQPFPGDGYTRMMGYAYYSNVGDNTHQWMFKFKPSNDWYYLK